MFPDGTFGINQKAMRPTKSENLPDFKDSIKEVKTETCAVIAHIADSHVVSPIWTEA
jgi:hypothetical protein